MPIWIARKTFAPLGGGTCGTSAFQQHRKTRITRRHELRSVIKGSSADTPSGHATADAATLVDDHDFAPCFLCGCCRTKPRHSGTNDE
jgi:hypothetical protein